MKPFACAERISARLSPKVRFPPAGRATSRITTQREPERAGVREHVGGVREERERMGEDAGDDLGDHQAEDQGKRDPEAARIGLRPPVAEP